MDGQFSGLESKTVAMPAVNSANFETLKKLQIKRELFEFLLNLSESFWPDQDASSNEEPV